MYFRCHPVLFMSLICLFYVQDPDIKPSLYFLPFLCPGEVLLDITILLIPPVHSMFQLRLSYVLCGHKPNLYFCLIPNIISLIHLVKDVIHFQKMKRPLCPQYAPYRTYSISTERKSVFWTQNQPDSNPILNPLLIPLYKFPLTLFH